MEHTKGKEKRKFKDMDNKDIWIRRTCDERNSVCLHKQNSTKGPPYSPVFHSPIEFEHNDQKNGYIKI